MNQSVSFEGKTVLLVEDELFTVEKISKQLETLGFKQVLTAINLTDAREHVSSDEIDIALLDVNLTEGETTIQIGEALSAKTVPVVFFSGFSVDDVKVSAGSHEFLEKPLSVPRLKAAMQRAMLRVASSAASGRDTKMAGPEARQSG